MKDLKFKLTYANSTMKKQLYKHYLLKESKLTQGKREMTAKEDE